MGRQAKDKGHRGMKCESDCKERKEDAANADGNMNRL